MHADKITLDRIFKKIQIHNEDGRFDKYEEEIRRPGVDRHTLANKIIEKTLNGISKSDLYHVNQLNYLKAIRYAINTFDVAKGYKLCQQINNVLLLKRPDIMEASISYNTGHKEVKNNARFMKDLAKFGIDNIDELNSEERKAFCEATGYSEESLKNHRNIFNILNPVSTYTYDEDGREYSAIDSIPSGESEIKSECHLEIYYLFSYIFKHSPDEQHEVYSMINSNWVRSHYIAIDSFAEFTNKPYAQYADKYEKYKDFDIIYYKWFDGKRQGDDGFPIDKFKEKYKTFKKEYEKPYNKLWDKYKSE